MVKGETVRIVFGENELTSLVTVEHEKNGATSKKNIPYGSLVKIFSKSTKSEFDFSFSIPENCVKIFGDSKTYGAWVYAEECVRPVLYGRIEEESYLIAYPKLLFKCVFDVESNELRRMKCFAIKSVDFEKGVELFKFPFSNVYNTGNVCLGSNFYKAKGNLKEDVLGAIDMFYAAPYNGDLYTMNQTLWLEKSVEKLFRRLNGVKKFPDEILAPLGEDFII